MNHYPQKLLGRIFLVSTAGKLNFGLLLTISEKSNVVWFVNTLMGLDWLTTCTLSIKEERLWFRRTLWGMNGKISTVKTKAWEVILCEGEFGVFTAEDMQVNLSWHTCRKHRQKRLKILFASGQHQGPLKKNVLLCQVIHFFAFWGVFGDFRPN